jgi:hypothetical protein
VPGVAVQGTGTINWSSGPTTAATYSRFGNTVTAVISVTGSYGSVTPLGSSYNPWITNIPSFGKSISNISGVVDSYSSSFTGAPLPYWVSYGSGTGPGPNNSVTFYTAGQQLQMEVSGGSFDFYFTITYDIY